MFYLTFGWKGPNIMQNMLHLHDVMHEVYTTVSMKHLPNTPSRTALRSFFRSLDQIRHQELPAGTTNADRSVGIATDPGM